MSQLIVYLIFIISIIVAGIIGMIAGTVSNYLYNKRGKEWDSLYPDKVRLIAECEDILFKNRDKVELYHLLKDEINETLDTIEHSNEDLLVDIEEKISTWKSTISSIKKDVYNYFEAERLCIKLSAERHKYCIGKKGE